MKHFLIYTNHHKDTDGRTTRRIAEYLSLKGQKVTLITDEEGCRFKEEEIPQDAYCMLVLGGDGTVLQAARDNKSARVPLIGVDMGTLGYLTEIEPATVENALDKLIAGDFHVESRMMLRGQVYRDGEMILEDQALNDIVISRCGSLKIVKLKVYVNGQFLCEYSADGVIVTTPTGSTGYNLSAGGPIVEPKAQLLLLTPICPHTLSARSIILSADDVVEIEIPEGKDGQKQEIGANFDGTGMVSIYAGDRIRIIKSEKTTEIIQINKVSFLEVLHKKLSDN